MMVLFMWGQSMCDDASNNQPASTPQTFSLTKDEVKVLRDKAIKGAPEPAFRLYMFYRFAKEDSEESRFWLQIAADNDHPAGQYNLWIMLHDDPKPINRQRAAFWLKRAAENGSSPAINKLKGLENRHKEDD
jgi:TPR repeat protein